MLAIIVGTHGKMAEELVKTCEMICGRTTNVASVTLLPGESADDLVKKYEAALEKLDVTNGVIILNDLFGGSPYNAACRLVIGREHYGVVTGVNLPMLIEMISYQACNMDSVDINDAMTKAGEAGKEGIQNFYANVVDNRETEEDEL